MADTIITNTPDRRDGSGAAGMILAIIVIIALIVAGYFLYRHGAPGVPNTGSTNVNVTLPTGGASDGSGGAAAGGGASQ